MSPACPFAMRLCWRWPLTEAPYSRCIFFICFTCRSSSAILQTNPHQCDQESTKQLHLSLD